MIILTLTKLVKSLSGPEKRAFKLSTRKQVGKKDYQELFDIVDKNADADVKTIQHKFNKLYPKTSVNNTARYLMELLTDSLIESKRQKDNFFSLLQEIMRARVLRERSLSAEADDLLKKIRQSSSSSQQHLIEYFTHREELNHAADANFHQMDDTSLIASQMRSKEILRSLNHIQDHHSLFELMKYRLIHSGKIVSENDKKRLNDLMLSEMTLVTGKSKNSFASQKLHLLFQSYFFTDIGDYQSALKTFNSLNKLFEQHLSLLDNPPFDYLSTINGILDSLNSLGKFDEMMFYIEKLSLFNSISYPEYFRYQALKTAFVYRLAILIGQQDHTGSLQLIEQTGKDVITLYDMVNEEKQWEIYFYSSLIYFMNRNWKKAHELVNIVMQKHKMQPLLPVCKALRLLNILIYYERGDTSYIEYEIRSYKRMIRKTHSLLRTETLLLKFILQWPDIKRKRVTTAQYDYFYNQATSITRDKYEQQLLKYFDFTKWMKTKLTRQHS